MLSGTSLAVIIFAVLVGIFILIANVYLSIGYGAVTAISQIIPDQSLETWSPNKSLERWEPNQSLSAGGVIDPILQLNKISPVYTAQPEFSAIRNSIVKPNGPIPVATSVTV